MIKNILKSISLPNLFRYSAKGVVSNYFWLYFISAFLFLIFKKNWLFNILFPFSIYCLLFKLNKIYRFNCFDIIYFLYLIWTILGWLGNSMPEQFSIIRYSLQSQICYMLCYVIARNTNYDFIPKIVLKSFLPLAIACVLGIILFFVQPEWYMNNIKEGYLEANGIVMPEDVMVDAVRLRSIFPDAYTLSYFTAIVIMYMIFRNTISANKSKKDYFLFFLFLITNMLCMMRAPMLCIFIAFVLSAIYSAKYLGNNRKIFKVLLVVFVLFIPILAVYNSMDNKVHDFIESKISPSSDKKSSFVEDRLYLMKAEESLLGDGLGRHGRQGEIVGERFMPDGEYMKILQEQGYIGLCLIIFLFGIALLKGLYNFRYLYFETCLIIMVLICMIGADPLSIDDKHCFIYWLALGRVSSFNNKNEKENRFNRCYADYTQQ